MTGTGERPVLSATEAARVCGVSVRTMSRRLNGGGVPGAERLPTGGWAVPLEGLLAAGFHPYRSEPEPAAAEPDAAAVARVAELERELVAERHRRELAETRERGLERLVEQLRGDLDYQRQLTAGAGERTPVPDTTGAAVVNAEPAARRPRWWSFRNR